MLASMPRQNWHLPGAIHREWQLLIIRSCLSHLVRLNLHRSEKSGFPGHDNALVCVRRRPEHCRGLGSHFSHQMGRNVHDDLCLSVEGIEAGGLVPRRVRLLAASFSKPDTTSTHTVSHKNTDKQQQMVASGTEPYPHAALLRGLQYTWLYSAGNMARAGGGLSPLIKGIRPPKKYCWPSQGHIAILLSCHV